MSAVNCLKRRGVDHMKIHYMYILYVFAMCLGHDPGWLLPPSSCNLLAGQCITILGAYYTVFLDWYRDTWRLAVDAFWPPGPWAMATSESWGPGEDDTIYGKMSDMLCLMEWRYRNAGERVLFQTRQGTIGCQSCLIIYSVMDLSRSQRRK